MRAVLTITAGPARVRTCVRGKGKMGVWFVFLGMVFGRERSARNEPGAAPDSLRATAKARRVDSPARSV